MAAFIFGALLGGGLVGALMTRIKIVYPARQCPECGAEVDSDG